MGLLSVSKRDASEWFDLPDEEFRVAHIPVVMQQWEVAAVEQEPGEAEAEEVGLAWWGFRYLQKCTPLRCHRRRL